MSATDLVAEARELLAAADGLTDPGTPEIPTGALDWMVSAHRLLAALADEVDRLRVVDATKEQRKTKVANCARCDRIEAHSIGNEALLARRREQLAKARERISELEARIAELETDKPEPGPWLRGDELKAAMRGVRLPRFFRDNHKCQTQRQ